LTRSSSRRARIVAATAAIVLAACAQGPAGPLATVDGEEIPREQLEGWVRIATDANEELDPVGLQTDLLSSLIQMRIFEGILEARGLSIDPALLDETRAAITEGVGGELSLQAALVEVGFPEDFFTNVFLRQQALIDTLALELSAGQTLETRTARHILVETSEEADEVYALLLEGADFGELAQERSQDTGSGPRGGLLGPNERGAYVGPFDDAVWAAEIDVVLEPVQSEFGFHVIEVLDAVTLTAAELDAQARQNLVFEELSAIIEQALSAAEVSIDPTIGSWDATGGRVLPVGASN
jgi:parvulin-like peptidyl-prolyl isomerase